MDIRATAIPEIKVLTPRRSSGHRGCFCATPTRGIAERAAAA
jgi:hypothetical protein